MNKIYGFVFGVIYLAAICYHFIFRHRLSKVYKEFCFGLGSEAFWEKVIIVSTPIGIIFGLWFIISWF